jgi:hypothetical protein
MDSILSDTEGEITSIAIVLGIRGDIELGHFALHQSIAGHFLRCGIPTVMVVSNGFYNADIRFGGILDIRQRRVQLQIPNDLVRDYRAAGFPNQESLVQWLWESLPLTEDFPFQSVNGVRMDTRTLDSESRLGRMHALGRSHPTLRYHNYPAELWQDNNGTMFLPVRARTQITPSESYHRAAILNEFYQHVKHQWLDWDKGLRIPFGLTLEKRRILNNGQTVPTQLGSYPQDYLIVRKSSGTGTKTSLPKDLATGRDPAQVVDYFKHMFPQTEWSDNLDPWTIQGGNLFVSRDIVFIGRDEKSRFLGDSEQEISSLIKELVFGDADHGHVVWVGTEDKRSRMHSRSRDISEYNQPVYHIDLFFHPMGFLDPTNRNKLTLLFATPRLNYTIPTLRNTNVHFRDLNDFFDATLSNLREDLAHIGIEAEVISVPLVLQFDETSGSQATGYKLISGYSPFTNGLVDHRDGKTIYLMPHFVDPSLVPVVAEAQSEASNQVDVHPRLNVVPVLDHLLNVQGLSDASLRCRVKVLRRE